MSNTHVDELSENDEAFFMPAHGLFADWESARGCVCLPDEFANASALAQIKILGDWKREMAARQAAAFVSLFRNVTPAVSTLNLAGQIAHFRRICEDEGLDCSDEIAALLHDCGQASIP